jgi:uncharacterized RmlC-like cupin family protein
MMQSERIAQEMKRVVRCFQRYTHTERASMQASHRLGHRQRQTAGEYFYVHPDVPERAFPTRKMAALAAIRAQTEVSLFEPRHPLKAQRRAA